MFPLPKLPARAMLLARRDMASAVDSTPVVVFSFCFPSRVAPALSSRKMVHTFSTTSVSGSLAFRSKLSDSWAILVFTISISASRFSGAGRTTMLNRRFKAADISLTPLSLVLAVAMTENPFLAGTSMPNSGTEIRFSDKMEIRASLTSEAHLEISSTLAMAPSSMARYTGLGIMASFDGPLAMSMA